MSRFDGEKGDLTYGDALIELAKVAAWGSDEKRDDVIRAFEKEFSIGYHHPDRVAQRKADEPVDPRDAVVAELQKQLDALRSAAPVPVDPRDAEIAALRAQLVNKTVPVEVTPADPRDAELAELRARAAAVEASPRPASLGPVFAADPAVPAEG